MDRWGPAWWLAGLGGIAVFAALRFWDPADAGLQVCVYRAATDMPCPGCGLTRASALLSKGSFGAAFAMHPLAALFAVEAIAGWIAWGVAGSARSKRFLAERVGALVLANVVPLFALWLGRAATGALPY